MDAVASPNQHWIQNKFENLIAKGRVSLYPRNEFHPHWAGKCSRFIQLVMNGFVTEASLEHRTQRIFDVGTEAHMRYGRYFRDLGVLIEAERSLCRYYEPIFLVGHCDYILADPDGKDFLVELKTINKRGYDLLNRPVFEHFLQWNLYSGGFGIMNGAIVYECKNDQNIRVFPVTYDDRYFLLELGRFIEIHQHTMDGKSVPIPDSCSSKWCQAKGICKKIMDLNGGAYGIQTSSPEDS